ncbi:MAG: type I DNA topoisomerase [Firmicutes bacterium]|nr:type I DNA topoisomerase [Bacillota bacterium]
MAAKKKPAKKTLVIVESPSKAKTIGKFLGSRYKVVASVGHVRDLPKSKLGIDIENDFEPQYINIRGKGEIIRELKKEAKKASKVYLATDLDREGEAISWHLAWILGIDQDTPCRIVFNEITKKAIKEAIKNPRPIDISLVDAQQARRVLDRLVGYQISPLLWTKIRRGLSAGRVQSAALKIICDREREIQDFVPEEFWTITADFEKDSAFQAKLATRNGRRITVRSREESDRILKELREGAFEVTKVEEKDRQRKPAPPFTTSSMQQDAANKINFTTRKTMMIAQQLYEGVEIKGMGTVGLVSYIRTDSVRVSDESRAAAKEYITDHLGEDYYEGTVYANRKKEVQDAHEAIRPSHIELDPENIREQLTKDQYQLYRLIWNRFLASQMAPAKFKAVGIEITNGDYGLRATGQKLLFDGFLKIYDPAKNEEENSWLPELVQGESLKAGQIEEEQNFTQPPARFTEASLVKDLEEKDIGRPSTYAPIVATLSDRKYIRREKKSLVPTDLGFMVTDILSDYFHEIVDAGFTAEMEEKLDDVESKGVRWKSVIEGFYGDFEAELKRANEEIEKMEPEIELIGENCELCGKPLAIKHGPFGDFIGCTGYPECKNTRPIIIKTGVKCPSCGGDILEKRSKRGRTFYGCSGYPDCTQVFWNRPVDKKCPECGSLLVEKKTKNYDYQCSNKECKYKE